jgi:hypothetical protein
VQRSQDVAHGKVGAILRMKKGFEGRSRRFGNPE